MQKIGFAETLDKIIDRDPRFDREAYSFLRDALDFTVKQRRKRKDETSRHVSGQELLHGVRLYALKEFGPMVVTVLDYWGVRQCEDIGAMVFNLIEAGVFGKTDTDSVEDFRSAFDFHEAFVAPFLPDRREAPEGARAERAR